MSRISPDTKAAFTRLGAPPPPDVEGPFADAIAKLTLGGILSSSVASARAGMIAQIHAAISAFREIGEDPSALVPLANLARILRGLELGINDPIVTPAARPASRPQDGDRVWGMRACLVAAYEIRVALGENNRSAASRVCADIRQRVSLNLEAKTLLDWRKRMGRTGQNAAPRDGEHREILSLIREAIAHASTLPMPERMSLLARSYEPLLEAARNRMPEGPQARRQGV
ncbi:hypothetical protein [Microvirga sesbaniae]|uniref:hypothetical protein n=1 Tax=Microvirga sesbaniae TaxID=681392 RepID=UPI0021C6FD53|nr:hypothetical protein [Microvirga sp. HBU67692]